MQSFVWNIHETPIFYNDRGDFDVKGLAVVSTVVLYIYIYTALFRKSLREN